MESPELEARPPSNPMPLGGRLVNVFAAPRELFATLAQSAFSVANWLVPAALVAVVGIVVNLVIFNQPALAQQMMDLQEAGLQKAVAAGKMRAEDLERTRDMIRTVSRIAGPVFATITAFVIPFVVAFFLWLIGRLVFRQPVGYLRTVEVASLAGLIGALGAVVSLFLQVGTGRLLMGPQPAAFISNFDVTNRLHLALAALNVFGIWQVAVAAVGLSRLISRPVGPVAIVTFGLWIGYKAIAVILGRAEMAF